MALYLLLSVASDTIKGITPMSRYHANAKGIKTNVKGLGHYLGSC